MIGMVKISGEQVEEKRRQFQHTFREHFCDKCSIWFSWKIDARRHKQEVHAY